MKFLVLGDIHANLSFLARLLLNATTTEYDAIILVGDLGDEVLATQDADHSDIRREIYQGTVEGVFDLLSKVEKPVYYILGNRDDPNFNITRNGFYNIDILNSGKHIDLSGVTLLGVGGSNYDPTDLQRPSWYNEWQEDQVENKIKNYINQYGGDIDFNRVILVAHDAPWFTLLDRTNEGIPIGSEAIRRLIRSWEPSAFLCGHVHESYGVDILERNTIAINAGAILFPSITYLSLQPPSQTEVMVTYCEHLFMLEINPPSRQVRAWHCVSTNHANGKIGFHIEQYSIGNGQLLLNNSRPAPYTGESKFPTKLEWKERLVKLKSK